MDKGIEKLEHGGVRQLECDDVRQSEQEHGHSHKWRQDDHSLVGASTSGVEVLSHHQLSECT